MRLFLLCLVSGIRAYRSTVLAFLVAVNALLSAGIALLDNDVTTNPDWNMVVSVWVAAFALMMCQDPAKSSPVAQADEQPPTRPVNASWPK